MKVDDLILPVMLIIGVFGGLAVVMTMADLHGGNWTGIANYLAPLTLMIAVFALVIIAIVKAR